MPHAEKPGKYVDERVLHWCSDWDKPSQLTFNGLRRATRLSGSHLDTIPVQWNSVETRVPALAWNLSQRDCDVR